jgi:hypothetical protein
MSRLLEPVHLKITVIAFAITSSWFGSILLLQGSPNDADDPCGLEVQSHFS